MFRVNSSLFSHLFRPFPQQPLLADIVSLRVFSCSNEWLPVRWRV